MVSSETAAPSALSFTTTTSPGMTLIRKNTAMATPIRVGITKNNRRKRYQSMGGSRQKRPAVATCATAGLRSLRIEPNRRKVLPQIVAGGHIPAVDLLVDDDDPLPPQQGYVVGLGQGI